MKERAHLQWLLKNITRTLSSFPTAYQDFGIASGTFEAITYALDQLTADQARAVLAEYRRVRHEEYEKTTDGYDKKGKGGKKKGGRKK